MGDKKDNSRDDRFAAMQKAVEERDRFLEARPHLKALQEEINDTLKRAGNSTNRISVLDSLLKEKAGKLSAALRALTDTFADELGIKPTGSDEPAADSGPEEAVELEADVDVDGDSQESPKIIGPADAWPQRDANPSKD
jgi:hypothetical protein